MGIDERARVAYAVGMVILGIETSCDETSAAVLEVKRGRFELRSHVVASQIAVHTKTGGVVPEVAAREHMATILPTIQKAMRNARIPSRSPGRRTSFDAIGVTSGPGLLTSLLVGVETAKALSYAWRVPLVRVNHIEGHIYANWLEPSVRVTRKSSLQGGLASAGPMNQSDEILRFSRDDLSDQIASLPMVARNDTFPLLVLVVSGGHTELILMKGHGVYKKIGGTQDDAAGEAFDKVARLLGLGYPGGPEISKRAEKGDAAAIAFPRPMLNQKNFDFSFSGLKTAVLYEVRGKRSHNILRKGVRQPFDVALGDIAKDDIKMTNKRINDIAASFQRAVVDVLVKKTMRAAVKYKVKGVLLSGGVAANRSLRETLSARVKRELPGAFYGQPRPAYCTDNAAMIAAAAYFHARAKDFTPFRKLKADANWELV